MNSIQRFILISQAFIILAFGMLSPIYAIYVEEVGGGILVTTGSTAAFMMATGILVFILGRWEDHQKHLKKLIILGYFFSALGFLGYIFVTNVYHLFIVQALLGISIAVRSPALSALYSKKMEKGKRVSVWSEWEAMWYIVTAAASISGGLVVKYFGFHTLLTIMFISSVCALIASLSMPEKAL